MGTWTGSQFLEGVAGKEGVTLFSGVGGCSFCIKINKTLKYLTTEKVYKQIFFAVITKYPIGKNQYIGGIA